MLNGFIKNVVVCVVLEVLTGVLIPEGKMKEITLSMSRVCLLYIIFWPLVSYVSLY